MRNRFRSIILLFFGVILGIAPIFAANIFMRDYVLEEGQEHMEQSAARALGYAENLVQEAIDVFSALPHYRVPKCDANLKSRFLKMVMRHSVLHEIGLVYNGEFMFCSSHQESNRFYPLSFAYRGAVPHLTYTAVRDGETDKLGLLIKWRLDDHVALGGFIPAENFDLGTMHSEYADSYHVVVKLPENMVIAESSPESRLHGQAPFFSFQEKSDWNQNLIEQELKSSRYPIAAWTAVPFEAVWGSFGGAMNVINGLGILTGALILLAFLRAVLRKPDPYVSIEQGIKRREFIPYYQPIIDIQNNRLAGCEVLVRWRKPDGSIVPPGNFIAVAENTGLARNMTTLLMEQIAEDLSDAYDRNPGLKAAINLFNRHFDDLEIVKEIELIFGNSGVRYSQLVFEITERQPLENLDRARAIIARMQKLGARVALDDAGTGHGGFTYLQTLGMDIIKIDKLFVDVIGADQTNVPIVDSLSQMAKGMNMVVVAEGVETEEQLIYLRRSGINEAQGYLFAPPLPASSYIELVEAMSANSNGARVGGDVNMIETVSCKPGRNNPL